MSASRAAIAFLALGALALAFALGFALPSKQAEAHAVLERSLPVQNQKLEAPPERVEVYFSEEIEQALTQLEVLDTQGNPVHTGETVFSNDPFFAAIAVPPDLAPGIYTVTYENVSRVDGHTWSGFFSFIILNADGTVPAGEALIPGGLGSQVGLLPDHADSALRWLGLIGATMLVGAALFVFLIARPAAQFLTEERGRSAGERAMAVAAATIVVSAALLAIANVGQLLLLADRLGGLGEIDDVFFTTRTGELWLSRICLSIALLLLALPPLASASFRASGQAVASIGLALLGGLGMLITYSLSSHAGAGGGAFWAIASDFVHFAATAAWLGTLLPLAAAFWWSKRLTGHDRPLYLANVLDRFSWVAVISVALIIGTGTFNGFVELPRLPALWETTYGKILIAKLVLILPLLGVAAINARFLKPALVDAVDAVYEEELGQRRATGGEGARLPQRLERLQRLLPRTVIAELLLGVAVLASVSVLAQSTTAEGDLRLQAARSEEVFESTAEQDDLSATLTIDPFTVGLQTARVKLTPLPGNELGEVLQVSLRAVFDNPDVASVAGISFVNQVLEPAGDRTVYEAETALLTQPGDWRVQARVRRRGLDDTAISFSVPRVGGFLARGDEPNGLFDLPFTFVDWNVVGGGTMIALGLGAFFILRNRPPSWQRSTGTALFLASTFAMIAGAILVFGVDTHGGGVLNTSPVLPTRETLAIGQDLFDQNCMVCHGPQGEGDPDLPNPPPPLTVHIPAHNDGTVFAWITEGIPLNSEPKNMPAFKDLLTTDQRWHIVTYLRVAFGSGDFEPVLPEDLQ